jgi:predicted ATPase/class 3 adenylate cyclase/DNA-binding winged helix-turn-helix (wHTH) protein/tetratricopeptide (TPR) repeat protein
MDFRVLGPLEVSTAAGPVELRGDKRRGLLAYLVVHRGEVCRTDQLIDALWNGEPHAGAVGTVHTYVSQLRKILETDTTIHTRTGGYVLDARAESVDAERFETLLDRAVTETESRERLRLLNDALALYRGRMLEEFTGSAWADDIARRWDRLHIVATERLCDTMLELDKARDAQQILERAVAASPLHERFWAQLATARYRVGDPSGALAACRDARHALIEALGIDPGPELQELERMILDHDPTIAPRTVHRLAPAPALPTGVVTFLITDIDRSARLWENSPREMADALARHDQLIEQAVAAHSGYVFKHSGDGLLAVFSAASTAVAAAVDAQKALLSESWTTTEPIRARMALHTGEAIVERDGDYFGPVLNRCARVLALAKGAQVLVTGTVADALRDHPTEAVTIEPLGEHRLRDLAQPERVAQVCHAALPHHDAPLRSLETAGNLPVRLTSFVGRDDERARVVRSLDRHAITTLVGPAGIGKTSLALRVAHEVADDFDGGAWFVDLSTVSEHTLVAGEIASVLGISAGLGQNFVDTLVQQLADREALLVLDNCEQVIDGVAEVASAVLRSAAAVRLIATSRQPLELAGEAVVRIGPLETTGTGDEHGPAVRLFIERAQATSPTLQIDAHNVDTIRELCTRLEGIPLALELAAARVRLLQPSELIARLDDRFRLLRGTRRDQSARHLTLHAAIDWSYTLLSDEEQRCFARLSVFRGGFDLDAAAAMTADVDGDCIELLDRLVSRSFVTTDLRATPTRYRLLETLREYGVAQLGAAEQLDETRERHARYFLARDDFATDDIDNLRAAIDWQTVHEPDNAARTVLQRWPEFARTRLVELQRWLEALVDRVDAADDALVAKVAERLGDACFQTGVHTEDAIGWLERALAIREQRGESTRAGHVHVRLARNLSGYPDLMDIERASEHAARAESILRAANDQRMLAEVHLMQASTALYGRHNRRGVDAARAAIVLAEQQGLEVIRLHALAQLGAHLAYCGDVEEGFALLEHSWECADLGREHFSQFLAAWMRGFGALLLWDPTEALVWFERERSRAEAEEAPLQARTLDSMIALARLRTGDCRAAQALVATEVLNAPQLIPFTAVATGDWNRAISMLTAGAEASRRRGNRNEWTQLVVVLAQTHARLGDRAAARRLAGEALNTFLEEPTPYYELPIRSLLARLGVNEQAHLDACTQLCAAHDYRGLCGLVSLASAETAARRGDDDDANRSFESACATFERYGLRLDEADALASWSRALAAAGDNAGAHDRAERCNARLIEVDAPRWRKLLLGGAA